MFRIAEFAALAGTSPKVVRDYDAAGIFRPAWVDPASGYRGYSAAQLPALRRILSLRELGVPLAEIRRLVHEDADLAEVLEARRSALEGARREAERRLAAVGVVLDGRIPGVSDVVVRDLRPELVGVLDVATEGGDEERAFYELERRIRDARVRASRAPGAIVDAPPGEPPTVRQVFVPVRRTAGVAFEAHRLPALRAATALHRGSYATLEATRLALLDWIAAAGLVAGSPFRILYLQFGAEADLRLPASYLVDRPAALITELQVPVA